MLNPELLGRCRSIVDELPDSNGLPAGWKSRSTLGPFSNPWFDHWCVGDQAYVELMVANAKPIAIENNVQHDLLILHKGVFPLQGGSLCLGWVQAMAFWSDEEALSIALDTLAQDLHEQGPY